MKTVAQQLKITEFPFIINDENGNQIYHEDSDGSWEKKEFDENNNEIYCEDSTGYWNKREYDENDNQIYFKNSYGIISDNRPNTIQEYTMDELTKILGKPFKIVK